MRLPSHPLNCGYYPSPVITAATPASGSATGRQSSISRGRFSKTTAVQFGTASAASFTVTSPTTVDHGHQRPLSRSSGSRGLHAVWHIDICEQLHVCQYIPHDYNNHPSSARPQQDQPSRSPNPPDHGKQRPFGGKAGTVVWDAATRLVVESPADTPGTVTVKITTPHGSVTSATTFKFASAPTIMTLTPTSGIDHRRTAVAVTRLSPQRDDVGEVRCTNSQRVHDSKPDKITAMAPRRGRRGHHQGHDPRWTVTSGSTFSYVVPAPTLTTFTPTSGTKSTADSHHDSGTHIGHSKRGHIRSRPGP